MPDRQAERTLAGVTHLDPGCEFRGGQRQVLYLAAEQAGAGLDVRVAAPHGAPILDAALGRGLATLPLPRSRDFHPANLAALRGALSSADISGQIDALLFQVSSATQGRRITSDALDAIAGSARIALDQQAGVNLDEEASNLLRFQQAFQASGKAIQIASDLFDTLLAIR